MKALYYDGRLAYSVAKAPPTGNFATLYFLHKTIRAPMLEGMQRSAPAGTGRLVMAYKPYILLVEDDHDIQMAMLEVLEEEGYRVTVASNGQEALLALETSSTLPDIVLLDLMMPVMDGFEFRMRMRAVDRFDPVPVIVVSADRNARQKISQMKVAAFLEKPLNLTDLLDVLVAVRAHSGPGLG